MNNSSNYHSGLRPTGTSSIKKNERPTYPGSTLKTFSNSELRTVERNSRLHDFERTDLNNINEKLNKLIEGLSRNESEIYKIQNEIISLKRLLQTFTENQHNNEVDLKFNDIKEAINKKDEFIINYLEKILSRLDEMSETKNIVNEYSHTQTKYIKNDKGFDSLPTKFTNESSRGNVIRDNIPINKHVPILNGNRSIENVQRRDSLKSDRTTFDRGLEAKKNETRGNSPIQVKTINSGKTAMSTLHASDTRNNNFIGNGDVKLVRTDSSKRTNSNFISPSMTPIQNHHQNIEESDITPRGLPNSGNYCCLNSVIQLLRSCRDFCYKVEIYHNTGSIVNAQGSDEEKLFVNDFCNLMCSLKYNIVEKIQKQTSDIQSYFKETDQGDDVMQCFMKVLTKIHSVIIEKKMLKRSGSMTTVTPQQAYNNFRSKNSGFVFDLFYGMISNEIICQSCNKSIRQSFQLFKTLALPLIKRDGHVDLKGCLDAFFKPSLINGVRELNETMNYKCECSTSLRQKLYSIMKITHCPKYLFIYLNRGSYYANTSKNNTLVKCQNVFWLPVSEGLQIPYKLITVVDHIGTNENGHYYIKSCFEKSDWFNLNDNSVYRIFDESKIVTQDTIVFLFKKINDSEI